MIERPPRYRLQGGKRLSRDEADLAYRRSRPFLDYGAHLPLEHLLAEAYIQGVRDAVAVFHPRAGA